MEQKKKRLKGHIFSFMDDFRSRLKYLNNFLSCRLLHFNFSQRASRSCWCACRLLVLLMMVLSSGNCSDSRLQSCFAPPRLQSARSLVRSHFLVRSVTFSAFSKQTIAQCQISGIGSPLLKKLPFFFFSPPPHCQLR